MCIVANVDISPQQYLYSLTHTHEHFGFRMFAGQGVVLPRGDDIRQCPHPGDHTMLVTRVCNLHVALILKVRSHICKMHRNVLNALFKVEGFNKFMSELFWRFIPYSSPCTRWI